MIWVGLTMRLPHGTRLTLVPFCWFIPTRTLTLHRIKWLRKTETYRNIHVRWRKMSTIPLRYLILEVHGHEWLRGCPR
ncbi:hypothetical protein B0T17DRAFT_524552 [Bombardia bombarda]|uniref:Uncharacterized protein n=1 Tax=Bombardia bombarda TaxID=252184 RepID=A0AA39X863_9PEZI|nr:hypothetical protein B0T17DRAFT_524552 [Bombardia bombarda]